MRGGVSVWSIPLGHKEEKDRPAVLQKLPDGQALHPGGDECKRKRERE